MKEALARESVEKNAAGAERTLMKSNVKEEVFAMERNSKHNARGKVHGQNSKKSRQTQNERDQTERKCYYCGKIGHFAGKCRYRGATCHGCGKKEHLQKACRSSSKKTSNKFLEESAEPNSANGSTTIYNNLKFFVINAKASNANGCHNLIRADPKFLDIEINDKVVSMEVDTDTYFTVVSEKCIDKYFKDCKIDKPSTSLVNYEQNPIKPLGQLEYLKVRLNETNRNLNCFVLRGNGQPLIERQWLAEVGL